MNGTFDPTYSSNQIWIDTNVDKCLTTHLEDVSVAISSLQTGKADIAHVHSYNALTDKPTIPTTLPANGGNADTVDGKHASSFATASSVSAIQSLVNGTTDIVTAEGTSGNLTYRKWKSGTSEAWYYEELGELSLTTGMAGGVYSSTACNGRVVNFPSGLFVSKPLAVSNVYSDGYTFSQVAGADSTRLIYRIWSPYPITISGTEIVIHIIGSWK